MDKMSASVQSDVGSRNGIGLNKSIVMPDPIFSHVSWGGVYMDAEAAASKVRECFSQANEIVAATMASRKFALGERLTIVGSDFYGSYWSVPGQSLQEERREDQGPSAVLAEVLQWLNSPPPNNSRQRIIR